MFTLDLGKVELKERIKRIEIPGIYVVSVDSYSLSSEIENYKSTPFIKFIFKTEEEGLLTEALFWLPKEGEAEEKTNIKLSMLKEFLTLLDIDTDSYTGHELLKQAEGKKFKGLFKIRERIAKDNSNNYKPYIKEEIAYSYGRAISNEFKNVNEKSLRQYLSSKDTDKFKGLLAQWERDNGNPLESPISEENDNNLPF